MVGGKVRREGFARWAEASCRQARPHKEWGQAMSKQASSQPSLHRDRKGKEKESSAGTYIEEYRKGRWQQDG